MLYSKLKTFYEDSKMKNLLREFEITAIKRFLGKVSKIPQIKVLFLAVKVGRGD